MNPKKRKKKPQRGPFSIACPQAGKMAHSGYKPPHSKWVSPSQRASILDRSYDQFLK